MRARGILVVAGAFSVAATLMALAIHRTGHIDLSIFWQAPTPPQMNSPVAELPGSSTPTMAGSTLWLLAIGVSRYRHADFNLQFAAADAQAVADVLQQQGDGPLYTNARTLVLTDEQVTRESILGSMERFLGLAGARDVVAIFFAGHGVQDLTSGSYYFLPYAATPDNFITTGLRMTDFEEMVRVLRRNVRGVILMLDTCHAGALKLAGRGLVSADDLATRLSVGEGFFLLAAAKPGEESKEKPELGHGAFTYAMLEGLQGAADADGDGSVSVSEIFGYVARQVPRLTSNQQHPYNKTEGTDLIVAAVHADGRALPAPAAVVEVARSVTKPAESATGNTIGVTEFRNLRADPQQDWIGQALRVALNTELSKVRALQVFSPELMDRVAKARGADNLYMARQLGIGRLMTGSFSVVGTTIRIDALILDAATGVQEGSDSVQGNLGEFFDLQKKLVISMLRRLRVEVSAEEGKSIQGQTNTDVDAYRLLLEAEGVVDQDAPVRPAGRAPQGLAPQGQAPGPESRAGDRSRALARAPARALVARLWGVAYAADAAADGEADVRQFLEEYRNALEHKDLGRLAALYVSFSPRQRDALREYLQSATDLVVELADVTIEPHQEEFAVSYTRRDRFVDRESHKPTRVEVRLTKTLVRDGGTWKFASGR